MKRDQCTHTPDVQLKQLVLNLEYLSQKLTAVVLQRSACSAEHQKKQSPAIEYQKQQSDPESVQVAPLTQNLTTYVESCCRPEGLSEEAQQALNMAGLCWLAKAQPLMVKASHQQCLTHPSQVHVWVSMLLIAALHLAASVSSLVASFSWDRERPPPSHLCLIWSDMDWTLMELDHNWISVLKIILVCSVKIILWSSLSLWLRIFHGQIQTCIVIVHNHFEQVHFLRCWICSCFV